MCVCVSPCVCVGLRSKIISVFGETIGTTHFKGSLAHLDTSNDMTPCRSTRNQTCASHNHDLPLSLAPWCCDRVVYDFVLVGKECALKQSV